MDCVEIQEEDVVVAMTDGVVDNLWEHEIVENVCESMERWNADPEKDTQEKTYADGMRFVAQQLMNAARVIAQDPFAESPYMEKAIDEGLSIEGGTCILNVNHPNVCISANFYPRKTRRHQCCSRPV